MRPRWMRNRQDGGVVASGEADPEVGIVNQEQRATGDNTSTENQPTQEAGVIMNSSSQTGPETNVSNTPALESNLGMEPAATAGALRRSEEQGAQR